MKKRLSVFLLAMGIIFAGVPAQAQEVKSDDIVILYENDVHCAVDGYAKLAAMKDELAQENEHVGVVSVGDYIQGSSLGAISQGEYIVEIMNLVGYDAVTLGNHEFDYKLPRLMELVDMMKTKPVCSNFQKIGEEKTFFAPYSIITYGEGAEAIDIAYIGVTTPDTLTSSSPAQFKDENDNYLYTFNGENLCDTVQSSIDAAEAEGAEYIIALSHLGTENVFEEWSAQTLVQNTEGLDVVLDGHSHSVVESMIVEDESGEDVVISSTGTKFENIGKLTISGEEIKTELIATAEYENTDEEVTALIARINEEYSELGERKIGVSEVNLTTVDENGNRIIRHQETNLGDFCADAYRIVMGADIGFVNGGGIRADMAAGDVTFNDILSVFPFNNDTVVVRTTGQAIVDMLELGVMYYPEENGSFQHVSGITFELDESVPSTVKLDENQVFVSVEGERRVKNVKVLDSKTGKYEPIDLNEKYTLSSHSYLLLEQGGGASMFKDAEVISESGILDVELLEMYITDYLGGVIGEEYLTPQERITVVDGNQQEQDTTNPPEDSKEEPGNLPDDKEELSEENQPEDTSEKDVMADNVSEDAPKTGDNNSICFWMALLIVSGCLGAKMKNRER